MWGTGSPCGHTVMALRIDGSLYVVESQTKSAYWPKPFIQRNPYREWMELAHNASYNVLYLPLSPEARSAFDESAAQAFFVEVFPAPPCPPVREGQPLAVRVRLAGLTLGGRCPGDGGAAVRLSELLEWVAGRRGAEHASAAVRGARERGLCAGRPAAAAQAGRPAPRGGALAVERRLRAAPGADWGGRHTLAAEHHDCGAVCARARAQHHVRAAAQHAGARRLGVSRRRWPPSRTRERLRRVRVSHVEGGGALRRAGRCQQPAVHRVHAARRGAVCAPGCELRTTGGVPRGRPGWNGLLPSYGRLRIVRTGIRAGACLRGHARALPFQSA
eukprot:scaffold2406_cov363-Prasinococcus_capsulatus_cf.AAC.1